MPKTPFPTCRSRVSRSWLRTIGALCSIALLGACDFSSLVALNEEDTADASQEVTDQVRAAWRTFGGAASDAQVKSALADIEDIVKRAGSLPLEVQIGSLTKDDLAMVGLPDDPALAHGVLLADELDCSLDDVAKIYLAKNHLTLYSGSFDAFARDYTANVGDFLSGAAKTASFSDTFTDHNLSVTFSGTETGALRWVPGAAPDGEPILCSRVYQDGPLAIVKGKDAAFQQHYKIEVFIPHGPSKLLHLWAQWNQFHIESFTSETSLYIAFELGGMSDTDGQTSKLCRTRTPPPAFE